jgi:hypothetical protein
MPGGAPVRVLFIAGYLRTGSTLLERILGQVDGIESVGEIRYIWNHGFAENQLCGCGTPFRECPFWKDVVGSAFGGFEGVDVERAVFLQRAVDRLWHVPEIVTSLRPKGFEARLREYLGLLDRLLRGIRDVSGARVIVDSSKSASQGYLLDALANVDLRVLHLVRDSRGVAHSWTRRKRKPEIHWREQYMPTYSSFKSAFEWDVLNVGAAGLKFVHVPYRRARYEDLVRDPVAFVSQELAGLGFEDPNLDFLASEQVDLGINHTVAGNPTRFQTGTVQLRPDLEWQTAMPIGARRVVTALTWPLLRAYGYRDSPGG